MWWGGGFRGAVVVEFGGDTSGVVIGGGVGGGMGGGGAMCIQERKRWGYGLTEPGLGTGTLPVYSLHLKSWTSI